MTNKILNVILLVLLTLSGVACGKDKKDKDKPGVNIEIKSFKLTGDTEAVFAEIELKEKLKLAF